MGKDAAASATFLRVVDAAGTVVPCGSTVAAGTALTVMIDGLDPAVDQYVLEIDGASFLAGPCDRTRSNDAAGRSRAGRDRCSSAPTRTSTASSRSRNPARSRPPRADARADAAADGGQAAPTPPTPADASADGAPADGPADATPDEDADDAVAVRVADDVAAVRFADARAVPPTPARRRR
ncbi:hypothetical protein JL720_6572 [Aureococcus anophagefferens]|nr:hypothetical protein JL720_6572 [Aureococcus anophagefferens]